MEVAELQLVVSDRQVRDADRSVRRLEGGWSDLQRKVISVNQALDLTGRVFGAAFRGAESVVQAASTVEALQVRLVGLTESEEAAAAAYQNMARLAATTPFELKDVVEAGVTVRAFGDDNEETLKAVTDLAAFMGTSAVEAAAAYGRAFSAGAGAADILRERGVLALVKTRTGIDDLTKLSLPQFRRTLLEAMTDPDGRIAGSTDRLSKSWVGLTSNVSDALFQLEARTGEILTKSEGARRGLQSIIAETNKIADAVAHWADENRDLIDERIEAFFSELPGRLESAAGFVGTLATNTASWVGSLGPLFQFVADHPTIAAAIFGGVVAGPAGAAFGAGLGLGTEVDQAFPTAGHGGKRLFEDFGGNVAQAWVNLTTDATPNQPGLLDVPVPDSFTADPQKAAQIRRNARLSRLSDEIAALRQRNLRAQADAAAFDFGQSAAADSGGFSSQFGEGASAFDGIQPAGARPTKSASGGDGLTDAQRRARQDAAERSAAGFADARVTGASANVEVAQTELELYQKRIELATNLASTDQERARIMLGSETQQLALARQVDQTERSKLDAQIAALQTKQQEQGITAGEKAALDAQIAELQKKRDLLAESGGKAREIADEFARARAELAYSNEEQARAIREQVRPLEAVARQMMEIRELAAQPGASGILTPEVLRDYESDLRARATGTKSAYDEIVQATEGFGRNISRSLAEATTGARLNWQDFLRGLLTDVNEMLIHRGFTEPLMGFVEGAVIDPVKEKFSGGRDGRTVGRDAGGALWQGAGAAVTDATPDVVDFFKSMPELVGGFDDAAARTGDAFVKAAEDYGDKQASIFEALQGGLTSLLGGLGNAVLGLFGGGSGFSVGGLFAAIGIGAVKGAVGGLAGQLGGGAELVGPPQADGSFHDGGIVGQFYHRGGLRAGEVPAVLEEGELVVPRDTTAALRDLFGRRGTVRRYHAGGVIGDDGSDLADGVRDMVQARGVGGRRRGADGNGVTVNVSVNMAAQSFDPASAARLLMEQSGTIEKIVERGARKGASLSRTLGLRDRGQ